MNDHSNEFTAEQEELFDHETINEEYNLYIVPYVEWLRINHPEQQIAPGRDSFDLFTRYM